LHLPVMRSVDLFAPPLLFGFLFFSYRDHRDLHSFPTRRSSDLVQHVLAFYAGAVIVPLLIASGLDLTPEQTIHLINADLFTCGRSEEHTSELQSRENLVCRLLLEKKKVSTSVRNQHVDEARHKP